MALLRLPDLHYCFSNRVAEKNLLSVATALKLLIGRLRSLAIYQSPLTISPNTIDSPFLASISGMSYTDEGGFWAITR